jgi:cytochrome c oxidase subunit 1
MSTPIVQDRSGFRLSSSERNVLLWTLYLGFGAFSVGVVNGLGQALNYAGIDVLRFFPGMRSYYQGLTVHGVFNAIVLTFCFANSFLTLTTARGLACHPNPTLLWASFGSMVLGAALAAFAMFTGRASVLFTFYPPLLAHWTFYLGLALAVVSTWLTSADLFLMLARWRKAHAGERIPLLAFMSIVTYVMWDIASLGIAVEVVVFLLPWSIGLLPGADPLLSRTLFWFTGHPIVYFWLLPVYVSWYGLIPKQAGGILFSDTLTRVAFLMFLMLSIPVGFHHQFSDPGIHSGMKALHTLLTFGVFFPSLMTAFAVMYALEVGARRRGGGGLVRWFARIPWQDPSVAAQVLAMVTFLLGGATGLVNASYNVNQVVHNTTFIPGHFHMTVGSAVALSMMGIVYWLIPYLTGRRLWGTTLARLQAWVYFVGVLVFARGMISGGLEGLPRRTMISEAAYSKASWALPGILTGLGGTLMFVGAMLFFVVLVGTVLFGEAEEASDVPFTETVHSAPTSGWQPSLDRFAYWVPATLLLIAAAYGPFFVGYLPPRLISHGFQMY